MSNAVVYDFAKTNHTHYSIHIGAVVTTIILHAISCTLCINKNDPPQLKRFVDWLIIALRPASGISAIFVSTSFWNLQKRSSVCKEHGTLKTCYPVWSTVSPFKRTPPIRHLGRHCTGLWVWALRTFTSIQEMYKYK